MGNWGIVSSHDLSCKPTCDVIDYSGLARSLKHAQHSSEGSGVKLLVNIMNEQQPFYFSLFSWPFWKCKSSTIKHHFFFWLLALGVTTADHLLLSHPIPSILFYHTNPLHVVLHYIHEPLWSFSFPLQHPFSIISTILPLHMSYPSQPCLSNFTNSSAFMVFLYRAKVYHVLVIRILLTDNKKCLTQYLKLYPSLIPFKLHLPIDV